MMKRASVAEANGKDHLKISRTQLKDEEEAQALEQSAKTMTDCERTGRPDSTGL
jgi:hypothetical protein